MFFSLVQGEFLGLIIPLKIFHPHALTSSVVILTSQDKRDLDHREQCTGEFFSVKLILAFN